MPKDWRKDVIIEQAQLADGQALAELRAVAMRPSLEALGRFDPLRVRQRLLETFTPESTWIILIQRELAGFYVLREYDTPDKHLYLDHFYLAPDWQSQGLGAYLMKMLASAADQAQLPIRLGALRGSPANSFYQRCGYRQTHETPLDIYYERSPEG